MRDKGFTLVELLIGLTIFCILAVTIFGAFRSGILSWDKIESRLNEEQNMVTLFSILEREIHNLVEYKEKPFFGTKDHINFYTIKNIEEDGVCLNYIYNISYSIQNSDLIKTEARLGNFHKEKYMKLLRIKQVNFKYFSGGEWNNEWRDKEVLPKIIKIEIEASKNHYQKTIFIPITHSIDDYA
ncbi:MAG: prepilin-type N-terminal cleavage/methylation domain-containing protein [Patescibacteria group bacterium]